MSLSVWYKAKRDGECSRCGRALKVGDRMRSAGSGVYLCEACGKAAQDEGTGKNEQGVMNDLARFPEQAQEGSIAQNMIYLAEQLDSGFVTPRDAANYTKEIRQGLVALMSLYPPEPEKDATDDFISRRQRHLNEIRD